MIDTLKKFTSDSLFEATSALLSRLHIQFDRETAEPIDVSELYDGQMPKYLTEALTCIDKTYFIGIVNDGSLQGIKAEDSLEDVADTVSHGGKYDGMFIFACDAFADSNLTRSRAAALTRAFNRIASANPVILVIRQGNLLSLATCERMEYIREGLQGTGEKLGKVSILRNINCDNPHRGHHDILLTLGDKPYSTFDALYVHWMEVFSSELLTRKFYNELSDWYAWAVQIVRFPNDLRTEEDDGKYNHEGCIRLITRLIFIWFIKQKGLVPEELFNEDFIRDNFIDDFNPHIKNTVSNEQSKYYRLILQNLFFAMLNCPIVAEGKGIPNNRRFRSPRTYQGKNADYGINNLMRYEFDFKEGGAQKLVKLANSNIPFLNGGLFDCLDDKPRKIYYDGFSENKESLSQLFIPDYLFFGEEVGANIDLSYWSGEATKRNVSVRGLIDILKRYCFTVEENTPYDQEVSLDPELLGKVFENLLAAFNPETRSSARKQTGSYYTPRDIVQYMVDESLVTHLKRICGEDKEETYRRLLNYTEDEISLPIEDREKIMHALYNCKVIDPACGSGAFPVGILQQMVHVLKKIDPSNEMWKELVLEESVAATERAFKENLKNSTATPEQKAENDRILKERTDDIEESFNARINDPDYARKLYLIENCIYGVDIQPIAIQISKLRFFISLVVDQKPTKDAVSNFGIRPLPNLEAKFVTANTLVPLDREANVFTATDELYEYEKQLHEINHRIFLARRNKDKEKLRELMTSTRCMMAQSLENLGFVSSKGYDQLITWDMFDQNASAPFFDPEWMFGIKECFDIVIGNPPWGAEMSKDEKSLYKIVYPDIDSSTPNTFAYFIGFGLKNYTSCMSYVLPDSILTKDFAKTRHKMLDTLMDVIWYQNSGVPMELRKFCYVDHDVCILNLCGRNIPNARLETNTYTNGKIIKEIKISRKKDVFLPEFEYAYNLKATSKDFEILSKLTFIDNLKEKRRNKTLGSFMQCHEGIHSGNIREKLFRRDYHEGFKPLYYGGGAGDIITPYVSQRCGWYVDYRKELINRDAGERATLGDEHMFILPKIYITRTGNPFKAFYDEDSYASNNFFSMQYQDYSKNTRENLIYLLPFINSGICRYFIRTFAAPRLGNTFIETKIFHLLKFPIPEVEDSKRKLLLDVVNKIIAIKQDNLNGDISCEQKKLDILLYKIYGLSYDEVRVIDCTTNITLSEYE